MILTQCPSCRTLFRLDDAALSACGGAVRCGQCGAVFQADVYRIDEATTNASEPKSRPRRRWPLAFSAVFLTLTLGIQTLYATRNAVARVTFVRPAVNALCRRVNCRLAHPAALSEYRLAHPEVQLGAHAGILQIRGELQNRARFRQSLPLLSVTILGPSQNIVARAYYDAGAFLRHARTHLGPGEVAHVWLDIHVPANASNYRLGLFPNREE
ncbi:MAG: zinc-ribbon and DUF3426 domain-containing protein [Acidiferrobacter sp.]